MTWEQITAMATAGQEIANHTYSHRDPDKQSLSELKADILAGDSAIFAHTGIHPTALAYPYNHHNDEQTAIATELSLIPRLAQQSFGGKRVPTENDFDAWLFNTLRKGGWTVTMTHGIADGYDALPNPALFETYLRRLAQLQAEGEILILPFSEAASYMQARM
jgi:peptidoglycan/xylan/chitin deacetylase (PgdA/CDA1 family)